MRPIYRYCLTGRMQFNSSRWLSCIFNYTNISCRSSIQSWVIIFAPTCSQPITIIPTNYDVSYWLSDFCVAKVPTHRRDNSNRSNKPYTEIHVTWDVMLCYRGSGFLCFENHSPFILNSEISETTTSTTENHTPHEANPLQHWCENLYSQASHAYLRKF